MELRTKVEPGRSSFFISYSDPVMFVGSCFASEIGKKFEVGRMSVMINPAGTVYNPVSVINTLNIILSGKVVGDADLHFNDGRWLSLFHYTNFSSSDKQKVIDSINRSTYEANLFLEKAKVLFITFGTARVYRFLETGAIVSNCHKISSNLFSRELLSVDNITQMWEKQLDTLQTRYPGLKVVFTISPVRHWKDGAHGNQVSKSVLFLSIENLLAHKTKPGYFPAFEIFMDELRDYRFYDNDMLHPSSLAVDYIWEIFSELYLDEKTRQYWREAEKITKASKHRLINEEKTQVRQFAQNMLDKISKLESSVQSIDLKAEKEYFSSLMEPRG
ncbi:MAG TPA: GSCFA domain-containing protein [Bacteroidales bacterium]|nr:GSCFA domain-containing protein [Bacteroidales bacterium]